MAYPMASAFTPLQPATRGSAALVAPPTHALFLGTERSVLADAQLQHEERIEQLNKRWAEVRATWVMGRRRRQGGGRALQASVLQLTANSATRLPRPSTTGCRTHSWSSPNAGLPWRASVWTCVPVRTCLFVAIQLTRCARLPPGDDCG
jgi:hypothetical protein